MERRRPGEGSLSRRGPSWTLRYKDARGRRRRTTLGRISELDKAAARHKAEEFLHGIGRRVPVPEVSVARLVDDHLAELAGYCSEETIKSRRCLLVQAACHFAGIPAPCVDLPSAQRYVAALAGRRLASSTIRAYAIGLRVLWDSAKARGLVRENPWRQVRLPGRVVRDYQIVEPEEADRIVAACDPRIAPLVAILAETGVRIGEALALRWQDVRMPGPGREGHFHVRKSKTRRPRTVWMTPRAVASFAKARLRGENGMEDLVCDPGVDRSTARKLFLRALAAAGLPQMRLHDLRHSFGDRLGAAGSTEGDIADVLGHANTQTTTLYVRHKRDAAGKRAIDRLAAHERPSARQAE